MKKRCRARWLVFLLGQAWALLLMAPGVLAAAKGCGMVAVAAQDPQAKLTQLVFMANLDLPLSESCLDSECTIDFKNFGGNTEEAVLCQGSDGRIEYAPPQQLNFPVSGNVVCKAPLKMGSDSYELIGTSQVSASWCGDPGVGDITVHEICYQNLDHSDLVEIHHQLCDDDFGIEGLMIMMMFMALLGVAIVVWWRLSARGAKGRQSG